MKIPTKMNTARCKLLQYVNRHQNVVSFNIPPKSGAVIVTLNKKEGYGYLKNTEGENIYFSCDSVISDEFSQLEEGMSVWYVEKEDMKGPYASLVKIIKPIS